MSFDLFVYSKEDRVATRQQLALRLRQLGWEVVFIRHYDHLEIADKNGPLSDTCDVIMGWFREDPDARRLRGYFTQRDRLSVEQTYNMGIIGSCTLTVDEHFSLGDELSESDLADLAHFTPADHLAAMQQAKTRYHLSAEQRQADQAFQLAVSLALSLAVGGVFEDMQAGRHLSSAEITALLEHPEDMAKLGMRIPVVAQGIHPVIWITAVLYMLVALWGLFQYAFAKSGIFCSIWLPVLAAGHAIAAIGLLKRKMWAVLLAMACTTFAPVVVGLVLIYMDTFTLIWFPPLLYAVLNAGLLSSAAKASFSRQRVP